MNPLEFQTDFGLVNGAVRAMYGAAYSANPQLRIHDLTHDITPYNIGTGNSWRIRIEPFREF